MIRKTVGRKLTTAVDVTVLLIISVFAYVNIRSHNHNVRGGGAARDPGQPDGEVEHRVRHAGERTQRIHETIRRLGQEESIERIRIMNKAGEITYSSDTNEIGKSVDLSTESLHPLPPRGPASRTTRNEGADPGLPAVPTTAAACSA